MRKELENAIVYIVSDYSFREQVGKDLEEGNRVVIISSESDVLSFYGLILESYGQYNLYLESDLNDVDDEYLEQVSNRDVTRDESAIYLGKPMSQIVSETIDELSLNERQKRVLTICKEILKTNKDIKQDAVINLLNDKLRKVRAENEDLQKELKELKKGNDGSISRDYTTITINADNFTSATPVMYIRELGYVPYMNTCIRAYVNKLRIKDRKKVKLVIFDNRTFDILYKDYVKVDSQDFYISNKNQVFSSPVVVSNQIYPLLVQELYRSGLDLLIIVDRILNPTDLIKGKNIHKYVTVNSHELLTYLIDQPKQDFMYILTESLQYTKGIILGSLKEDISTPEKQLYWFSKLLNSGDDKRLIFDIFTEYNQNRKEK